MQSEQASSPPPPPPKMTPTLGIRFLITLLRGWDRMCGYLGRQTQMVDGVLRLRVLDPQFVVVLLAEKTNKMKQN